MAYYANYQKYRDAWNNAYYADPPIPLNLDIELTNFCNLQCPFCFTTDTLFRKNHKPQAMPKDLAFRLIDEACKAGIPALKFNWRGESTLHQNFSEILKYAARDKCFYDIIINTNGTVPDAAINGLMSATKVVVSVDAFSKNTYSIMRKRGDIRTVITTIHKLIERGHDNIWVRRIITKENNNEPFAQLARETFGDKVKIAEHYCFDRNRDNVHEVKKKKKNDRAYCGYPSQRLMIGVDGKVFPCCADYYETMQVGDVSKQSIMDIWASDKIRQIRFDLRRHHFQDYMEQCKYCTSWMAYDSHERQFVQDRAIR